MADKIVSASLRVDTGDAVKNVLKLRQEVGDLRKEFTKAKAGSEEQADALKRLAAAEKKLAEETEKLTETNEKAGGSFSKLKERLDSIPGPVGGAIEGVKGLGTAFKALLANPVVLVIVAIVGALSLLTKAFASTRAGGEKIAQVMAGFQGAIDKVVQIVGNFITGITSMGDLLNKVGSFLSNPIKAFRELGNEISEAAVQTARLKKEQQQLERDQINFVSRNRELISQQEQLKNIRDNETVALGKRIAANEQAAKLEADRLKQAESNALRNLELVKKQVDLRGGEAKLTNEQLKELREAEAELADIREESAGRQNEYITNRVSLEREAEDKIKEAREKAAAAERERAEKLAEFNRQLLSLQQANQLAAIQDNYQKELKALEFKLASEKTAIQQAFKERRLTREQAEQLLAAQELLFNTERNKINEKQQNEVKQKEETFQKELADIRTRINLKSITDDRQLEKVQLQLAYEEKLQDAMTRYKDDAVRFQQFKQAIDQELKLDQEKLDKKNAEEDAKKKFEEGLSAVEALVDNPEGTIDDKRAKLEEEMALNDEMYQRKELTEAQYLEKKTKITEAIQLLDQLEQESANKKVNAIKSILNNAILLVGKQSALGKALAVASTTIDTIQSAVAAFKGMTTTIPGPVGIAAGAVAAAAATASGLASVKKILAVKLPVGDAGGSAPSASFQAPTAPLTPQRQSTQIDASSIQQIGNAQAGAPIRAYVVDADAVNERERQARLERASIIGG